MESLSWSLPLQYLLSLSLSLSLLAPLTVLVSLPMSQQESTGVVASPSRPIFLMIATIMLDLVRNLSALRGFGDRHGLKGLVRVIGIVEFDSGIERGTWLAAKKDAGDDGGGHDNPLVLAGIRRSMKEAVCVGKEVEVFEADHRFLLAESGGHNRRSVD